MINGKANAFSFSAYTLVYAVILIIALGLRFALLGNHPLNDREANLALQALSLSKGEEGALSGESGYLALTGAKFFIFGASDFLARSWPALFGSLLVLTPLLYQNALGRKTSLILAGLIAIDPVLVGASRTADGSTLALLGLLAGIGFMLVKKPGLSGICLGAALTGGPKIWFGVLLLVVLVLLSRNSRAGLVINSAGGLTKRDWTTVTLTGALSLIIISTSFFTNPAGISAVGSSLAEFFASLGEMGSNSILGIGGAWLWMELPAIALALWALVDGLLRKDALTRLLGLWWGLALILSVVTPANGVNHFHWMSIPILALAALKLSELLQHRSVENRLVFAAETTVVVALIVFSVMNLLALVNNSYLTPVETRNRIIGTLLPIVLLVVLTVLLSWGWSTSSTRKGFITGILVLFSFVLFSNTWKAADLGSRPQYEMGKGEGYPTGYKPLLVTIADISRWNTGYDNRIDILMVGMDLPSLEWALRDYERLSMESSYNPNLSPSLILTGMDQNITSSVSYRGQKFEWMVKPDLSAMKLKDWIKWAAFRTPPVQQTELILWARNDLFSGDSTP